MSYDASILSAIVVLALVFAFLNGFHDAANSIATVVSTRVLSPREAVAWAASGWTGTLAFILLAPVLGLALMGLASRAFRGWDRVPLERLFGRLQLVSAALYSLGHTPRSRSARSSAGGGS